MIWLWLCAEQITAKGITAQFHNVKGDVVKLKAQTIDTTDTDLKAHNVQVNIQQHNQTLYAFTSDHAWANQERLDLLGHVVLRYQTFILHTEKLRFYLSTYHAKAPCVSRILYNQHELLCGHAHYDHGQETLRLTGGVTITLKD